MGFFCFFFKCVNREPNKSNSIMNEFSCELQTIREKYSVLDLELLIIAHRSHALFPRKKIGISSKSSHLQPNYLVACGSLVT